MRTLYVLLLMAVVLPTLGSAQQTTVPHNFQPGTPARASEVNENFSALQAQVAALAVRIQALEDAGLQEQINGLVLADADLGTRIGALEAVTASVDGRTYCQNMVVTQFRGDPDHATGNIKQDVLSSNRRRVTFVPGAETPGMGTMQRETVSGWSFQREHAGDFTGPHDVSGIGSVATYSQFGTRVDIELAPGNFRTLYTSADGSIILQHSLSPVEALPDGYDRVLLRQVSFIEVDPGVDCQVEPGAFPPPAP